MAKKNPLVIEEERDEGTGPVIGYYSRGHHDPEAFVAAVRMLCEEATAHPRHAYWRIVPEGGQKWIHESGPGRGAFPVTHAFLL